MGHTTCPALHDPSPEILQSHVHPSTHNSLRANRTPKPTQWLACYRPPTTPRSCTTVHLFYRCCFFIYIFIYLLPQIDPDNHIIPPWELPLSQPGKKLIILTEVSVVFFLLRVCEGSGAYLVCKGGWGGAGNVHSHRRSIGRRTGYTQLDWRKNAVSKTGTLWERFVIRRFYSPGLVVALLIWF